jgi:hypothetical protein
VVVDAEGIWRWGGLLAEGRWERARIEVEWWGRYGEGAAELRGDEESGLAACMERERGWGWETPIELLRPEPLALEMEPPRLKELFLTGVSGMTFEPDACWLATASASAWAASPPKKSNAPCPIELVRLEPPTEPGAVGQPWPGGAVQDGVASSSPAGRPLNEAGEAEEVEMLRWGRECAFLVRRGDVVKLDKLLPSEGRGESKSSRATPESLGLNFRASEDLAWKAARRGLASLKGTVSLEGNLGGPREAGADRLREGSAWTLRLGFGWEEEEALRCVREVDVWRCCCEEDGVGRLAEDEEEPTEEEEDDDPRAEGAWARPDLRPFDLESAGGWVDKDVKPMLKGLCSFELTRLWPFAPAFDPLSKLLRRVRVIVPAGFESDANELALGALFSRKWRLSSEVAFFELSRWELWLWADGAREAEAERKLGLEADLRASNRTERERSGVDGERKTEEVISMLSDVLEGKVLQLEEEKKALLLFFLEEKGGALRSCSVSARCRLLLLLPELEVVLWARKGEGEMLGKEGNESGLSEGRTSPSSSSSSSLSETAPPLVPPPTAGSPSSLSSIRSTPEKSLPSRKLLDAPMPPLPLTLASNIEFGRFALLAPSVPPRLRDSDICPRLMGESSKENAAGAVESRWCRSGLGDQPPLAPPRVPRTMLSSSSSNVSTSPPRSGGDSPIAIGSLDPPVLESGTMPKRPPEKAAGREKAEGGGGGGFFGELEVIVTSSSSREKSLSCIYASSLEPRGGCRRWEGKKKGRVEATRTSCQRWTIGAYTLVKQWEYLPEPPGEPIQRVWGWLLLLMARSGADPVLSVGRRRDEEGWVGVVEGELKGS